MTTNPLDRLEALGLKGFTVSICVGPSGLVPCRWSVQVLSPDGHAFDQPYAADDFAHAVWIAETEIMRRGWCWSLTP